MLDLDAVEADLRRMQLEIERVLRLQSDTNLIQRHGSVRGRQFHVYNTLRRIQLRNQWKKDYIVEDESKVVLFYTSCRVIGETWERCKTALDLLRSLSIHVELRDLHISSDAAEEVLDRLGLSEDERGFLNTCLPLVYVNGYYFGNHCTLIELNEKGLLKSMLYDFEGRQKCSACGDAGYTVCTACRGGKKSEKTIFNQNLRCSFCDENGIVPCKKCLR